MIFNTLKIFLVGITLIPNRIYRLIGHLLFFDLQFPKNYKWWFWFAVLPFKTIDVILIPEIFNFLTSLFKFNARALTQLEINEAKKVFGNSINYNEISIDENSFFSWVGTKFNKVKYLGVCVFYSVNFNRKINSQPHNFDMDWLIHELTHTLQFKKVGSSYIFYALYAQFTNGYSVKNIENKKLSDFNFEQQAEIAKFYYQNLASEKNNFSQLQKEINLFKFTS